MVQGDDDARGALGVAHDVGQGLPDDDIDDLPEGLTARCVERAPAGLGESRTDTGGSHRGQQVVEPVPAGCARGGLRALRDPAGEGIGGLSGVVGGGAWCRLERGDGAPGVCQTLAGQGVHHVNGLVCLRAAAGPLHPLGQGDDRGQGVAHGVVELGRHPGLVAGGVALGDQPLLGGLRRQLGVPVLQGLPAGAGDRGHREHEHQGDEVRAQRAHLRPLGQRRGDEGAQRADAEADESVTGGGGHEQGVESQHGQQVESTARPPQVGGGRGQARGGDDGEGPAASGQQRSGEQQGDDDPAPHGQVRVGVRGHVQHHQLEEARGSGHRPQGQGAGAPPLSHPVQEGPRDP